MHHPDMSGIWREDENRTAISINLFGLFGCSSAVNGISHPSKMRLSRKRTGVYSRCQPWYTQTIIRELPTLDWKLGSLASAV